MSTDASSISCRVTVVKILRSVHRTTMKHTNLVDDNDSNDVAHQQEEGSSGRSAEVFAVDGRHDVGVSVDEAKEILQTPTEAAAAAQKSFRNLVVVTFELPLYILNDRPNE